MVNVSSTYRFQNERLILAFIHQFSSKSNTKMLAKRGPNGEPMAAPSIWSQYLPSKRKWLFLVANYNSLRKTTLGIAGGSAREYNLSRQMSSVSSSGTFVSREETAKKHIPLACLYFLAKSSKLKESLSVY